MTVLGHTIAWGTHVGDERTTDAKGWYTQMKTWWAAHKTARQEAKRAALKTRWDAQHEAVRTPFTVTATDAMEPAHAHLVATAVREFGV
jgi:hypothetical protein